MTPLSMIAAAVAVLLSQEASAAQSEQETVMNQFVEAVVGGDVQRARGLMANDAQIGSYFNQRLIAETLEVLIANFEGLSEVGAPSEDGLHSFNMCNGASTFVMRPEAENGRIVRVYYGAAGQTPPPVPLSARATMSRCNPPVRFVGM